MLVCIELYKEAEEVMRMAISEVPNYAQFYSSLGIMLGRQNRLEVSTCLAKCYLIIIL